MCVTDDPHLAQRCRSLRNLCFQPHQRFIHQELGWNYRMSNLQAALGLAQLERLDATLKTKRRIGLKYRSSLSSLFNKLAPQPDHTPFALNIYWVFALLLTDVDINARSLMDKLASRRIGTRPFFYPMHLQPALQQYISDRTYSLPVSERLCANGFYLPSGVTLTDSQVAYVSNELLSLLP